MEFKNILTVSIAVVLCMSLYVMKVTDANDPEEFKAQEAIERVEFEKTKVEQEESTKRRKITEGEKTKRIQLQLQEMRYLVQKGVAPFAARCMVHGFGGEEQRKKCHAAGGKPVGAK